MPQARTIHMAQCEVCGDDYEKALEVIMAGKKHVFDSFECAIHALAPKCENCGCRVIGHDVQEGDRIYCCAHCARADGSTDLKDHVPG